MNTSVSVPINSKGLANGSNPATYPLNVSVPLGDLFTTGTKRYISTSGTASTTGDVRMMANFVGNIWCSVGTVYKSSDVRIKKNILDVNDDTALDKILNIQPKPLNIKM